MRGDGNDHARLRGRGLEGGVPTGIRTPVATVKGLCPRPLDDGDAETGFTQFPQAERKLEGRRWWSQAGSNRRPPACHAGALPAELWPHGWKREIVKGCFAKRQHFRASGSVVACAPLRKRAAVSCRGVGPASVRARFDPRPATPVYRTRKCRPDNAVRCCPVQCAGQSDTETLARGGARAPASSADWRSVPGVKDAGRVRIRKHRVHDLQALGLRSHASAASAFSRILAARIGPFPFLRPLAGKWCPPCRVPREAMGHGRQANLAQARSGPTRHHLT